MGSIFNGFLADFPTEFASLSKPIVDASVEAYTRISVSVKDEPHTQFQGIASHTVSGNSFTSFDKHLLIVAF